MFIVLYSLLSGFLSLILVAMFILSFFLNVKKEISFYFKAACIAVLIWCVFAVFDFVIIEADYYASLRAFKYVGVAWFPLLAYLYIKAQVQVKPLTKAKLAMLCIIPVLTSIASLSNQYTHLMYNEITFIIGPNGTTAVSMTYGLWYYVHCIYSYLFILLASYLLFRMIFMTPVRFRKPIYLILFSTLFSALINILLVFGIVNIYYDLSVCSSVLVLYVCYNALTHIKSANIVMVSRDHIYDNLASMILVLDSDKIILDCNKKAAALFENLDVDPFGMEYEDFIDLWIKKYNGKKSPYSPDVLTVIEGSNEYHYNIVMQEVVASGQHIGYMVVVQEITQIYVLFRYLQDSALYDPLTGIYNRSMYTEKLKEYHNSEYLPLGIIIGDVNNLKQVNDTYGHLVGDELLKDIASILIKASPERAVVSRIGGDEFAIVLPNTGSRECDAIIKHIRTEARAHFDEEYQTLSIALGYALVTDETQDIQTMIKEADEEMYKDKNDRRKKRARR